MSAEGGGGDVVGRDDLLDNSSQNYVTMSPSLLLPCTLQILCPLFLSAFRVWILIALGTEQEVSGRLEAKDEDKIPVEPSLDEIEGGSVVDSNDNGGGGGCVENAEDGCQRKKVQ